MVHDPSHRGQEESLATSGGETQTHMLFIFITQHIVLSSYLSHPSSVNYDSSSSTYIFIFHQANREAPTLVFTSARGEVARINSTRAMVSQHTPQVSLLVLTRIKYMDPLMTEWIP